MKKNLHTIALSLLISSMSGFAQNACTSAPITNGASQYVFSSNQYVWTNFTASESSHQIMVWEDDDDSINGPDLDSVAFYSGNCSSTTLKSAIAVPVGANAGIITASGLVPGNMYFIRATRKPGKTCNACITKRNVFFYVRTSSSSCDNKVYNGGFDTLFSLPVCHGGPPQYNGTTPSDYTIGLVDGWTTKMNSINEYTADPMDHNHFASSSDYFNTVSGNIDCLNFTPDPRSGTGHGGMAFKSDTVNGFDYKEYIISDYGVTTPMTAGASYDFSYYCKREEGNVNCILGMQHTSSLSLAVIAGGSPVNGFQTPAANGWTKVDCYFTSPGYGNMLYALAYTHADLATSNNYFFMDDVSMYESVGIAYTSATTFCAGGAANATFQAMGSTSYAWSIQPGIPMNASNSTCSIPVFAAPGTYTLTVSGTTPNGCASTASILITVLPAPTVSVAPFGTITVCANQLPYTLSGTAAGNPGYQWYTAVNASGQGASPITGATTNTLVVTSGGYYFLTATNSLGCPGRSNIVQIVTAPALTLTAISTDEHCGDANDGTATASVSGGFPPYAYSWNTVPIQAAQSATGLDIGTYTVTVTDAQGCIATATALIATTPPLAAPVIASNAVGGNLCASTTVTYAITNYSSALHYSISYSPAPVSVTSPLTGTYIVAWPSATSDGTITVTVDNGNPTCAVSASLTVYACCGSTNSADAVMLGTSASDDVSDLFNTYNPTNAPGGIITHVGSNYTYSNPNGILYINGTFHVDPAVSSLTFAPGSQVRMGGNARIDMTNTSACTLTITDTHIAAGCNDMWDGIYASGAAHAVNVGGSVTAGSLIEDALNAIVSDNGAPYTIENAVFNKNYIAVKVNAYAGNHPGSVKNAVFTCRRLPSNATVDLVKGTYPPTYTPLCQYGELPVAGYQKALLLSPHTADRSYVGVYARDQGGCTLDPVTLEVTASTALHVGSGTSIHDLNVFDNMDFGVYADASNVTVDNNHFEDITAPTTSVLSGPTGIGVYGISNALSTNKKIDVGATTRNSFYDCGRGVALNGYYDADVNGNCLQSTQVYTVTPSLQSVGVTGISFRSGSYIDVHVDNNTIVNYDNGISLTSEYLYSQPLGIYVRQMGDAYINNNSISPTAGGPIGTEGVRLGISAQSLALSCGTCNEQQTVYGLLRIQNNTLTDVFNGELAQGWPLDAVIISDNRIGLRYQLPGSQAAIRGVANNGITIYRNHISGNMATGNTAGKVTLRGIFVSLNNGIDVRCNDMKDVGECMAFEGHNLGGVFNNEMYNCTDGFVLMNNGIIGQQGSPVSTIYPAGQASDNQWIGPFAFSQTLVDNTSSASNSPLYIRNTPVYYHPTNHQGSGVQYSAATLPIVAGALTYDCSQPPPAMEPENGGDDTKKKMLERTVLDSVELGGFADEARWMNRQSAYDILSKDALIMAGSSVLQQFYAEVPNTGVGAVAATDAALAANDTLVAQASNQAIPTDSRIEANYRDVNALYLALLSGAAPTAADIARLQAIAEQCPSEGGLAVYRARTLMCLVLDRVILFEDSCIPPPSDARHAHQEPAALPALSTCSAYPNPSRGNITFAYSVGEEQNASIAIYDMTGRVLVRRSLPSGTQAAELDLSAFASGMYYYVFYVDDIQAHSDKITISR